MLLVKRAVLLAKGRWRGVRGSEKGPYVKRAFVPAILKFVLVINGETARTLGLTIPASLRLRTDEVIE